MLDNMMKVSLTLIAFDKMSNVIKDAVNQSDREFDKLQRKIKQVSDRTKEMGHSLQTTGAGMTAAGVALGYAMLKPIQAYSDLEDAQIDLKTTMIDSTGHISKSFYEIDRIAKELGQNLPGTTADFYNMASSLKALGITDKSLTGGVMKSAAYLGVALHRFGVDYAQAAEYAAKFKTALAIDDKDMMGFMDVIQRTAYMGVNVEEMKEAFSHTSGILSNFGTTGLQAAKDLTPLLTMLIKTGVRGEHAGTGIARMFKEAYDIDKAIARLENKKHLTDGQIAALGVMKQMSFSDSHGNWAGTKNFVEQLQKLQNLPMRVRTDVAESIFRGGDFTTMALKIAGMGMQGYNQIQSQMNNQANLETKASMALDKLSETWNKFITTFETSLGLIAGTLGPEMIGTLNKLNSWSGKIGEWAENHKLLAKAITLSIVALTATLVTLGTLQVVIGTTIVGFSKLTEFYGGLIQNARSLTPVLKQNILQLLEFLGLNTSAHNLKIAESLKNAGNPLGIDLSKFSFKTGFMADIRRIDKNLRETLFKTFKELPTNITKTNESLKNCTITSIKAVPANFINGINSLKAGFMDLPNKIKDGIIAVRALSLSLLTSPLFWIGAAIAGAAFLIYKYWKPITGFFRGVFTGLQEGLAPLQPAFNSLARTFSFVLTPLKAVWNWIKNLVQPVQDTGNAAEKMGVKFGKVLAGIILKITDLIRKMFQLGAKVADFLSFGMLSKTGQTQKAISKHAQIIRDHLPHSPAKMGPLKDLNKIKIIETIAATIKPAPLMVAMNKALSFKSNPISMAGSKQGNSGGTISINYSPTINISGASQQDKEDFLQMLKQHKDEILRIVKAEKQRDMRLAY